MAYVVRATWTATPETVADVRSALAELGPLSRQEPGCRLWIAHQDPQQPLVFELFELYDDAEAYRAHGTSDHFQRIAVPTIPLLADRVRAFSETLDL
ncbi:putative quinol monooxygenase [Blastococcus atacamensis]|uniref:putative quinol monooxygenase n=1 Tax=Blastococcus atacamensis TaxID=2070508 RepID=UPI000CEBC3C8|nr:putative quinol monooxygenase [Blastococcus atacamensis]